MISIGDGNKLLMMVDRAKPRTDHAALERLIIDDVFHDWPDEEKAGLSIHWSEMNCQYIAYIREEKSDE